jgi:hypothetical protein
MGKTRKDKPGYIPKGMSRKGRGYRRGCLLHGSENCDWCLNNLTIREKRKKEREKERWDDTDE